MPPRSLSAELAAFAPTDIGVRAVGGLFSVLPFVATWAPTLDLRAAAAGLDPALADRVAARAEALARADGPQAAMAAVDFLDKADTGIALYTGLRGAVKMAQGQHGAALEMDPQQTADAGLKAVGVAWVAWNLFPGTVAERARALVATEAGRSLLAWYAAADLVLPFADNLAAEGVDTVTAFVQEQAQANAGRLAAVAGPDAESAVGLLQELMGSLRAGVQQASAFARPLADWAGEKLPPLLGTADKVTGVVATGVDALHAYRLIGLSLVAEVVLNQALAEVRAEVEAERVAAVEAERRAREEAERLAREEAERLAREEAAAAERRAREEAERLAREEVERREAEERARRSAQQEQYDLDAAVPAASLAQAPVKVTRSAEVPVPAADAPVAKRGCFGCASLVLVGLGLMAAAAATLT